MSQSSDNSRGSEYHTIYPSLTSAEDSDSLHDNLNQLENYFEAITDKHNLYIEERRKVQVGGQMSITEDQGRELIVLEQSLRDKLRELTQNQFLDLETQLNKEYAETVKTFNDFLTKEIASSNIKGERKAEFIRTCTNLLTLVEQRSNFVEQKLLPDQFRILRATATGVDNRLRTRVSFLEKELQDERDNFENKIKKRVAETKASLDAAVITVDDLKRELTDYTEEIKRLTSENGSLIEKVTQLQLDVNSLTADYSFDQSRVSELETTISENTASYDSQLTKLKSRNQQLEQSLLEKDSVLETTKRNETNLKSELKKSQSESGKHLTHQKDFYEAQLESLSKENKRLENLLVRYNELSRIISDQYEKNHTELVDLQHTFSEKQEEINAQYFQSLESIQRGIKQVLGDISESVTLAKITAEKLDKIEGPRVTVDNIQSELSAVHFNSDDEDIGEDNRYNTRSYYNTPGGSRLLPSDKDRIRSLEEVIVTLNNKLKFGQEETVKLRANLTAKVVDLNACRSRISDLTEALSDRNNLDPGIDMDAALTRNLGDLFSREEKKSIPFFNGQTDGKSIHDFLRTCKKISDNNDWDEQLKTKNIGDRLTGEANEWFCEFMDNLPINSRTNIQYTRQNLPYAVWEEHFIERFTNVGQIEKLRNKLHLLRQSSDQDVQSFIYNINNLYNIVNGKTPRLPNDATDRERGLARENEKLRSQEKLKILLRGLLANIKSEIWSRLRPNASYDDACTAALEAEGIVINKQISEDKGLTAVVAGFSVHEEQQDKELKMQKAEIELLKHHMTALTLSNNLQGMDSSPKLIAAVTEDRPQSRIRFERSLSESRESRSPSSNKVDKTTSYSRSPSPYPPRYNRDTRERQSREQVADNYKPNTNRDQGFQRERSSSLSRSWSADFTRKDDPSIWRDRNWQGSSNRILDRRGGVQYDRFRPSSRFDNNRFRPIGRRPFNQREYGNSRYNNRNGPFQNQENNFIKKQQIVSNDRNNESGLNKKTCFYCGKLNHIARECRKKINDQRGRGRSSY